jgi:hypothetical protein
VLRTVWKNERGADSPRRARRHGEEVQEICRTSGCSADFMDVVLGGR